MSDVANRELSVWEWIDYWTAGNDQCVRDGYVIDSVTRAELAWAAQSLLHLIATVRDISELDYSRAAINMAAYDAVRMSKNALSEYGIAEAVAGLKKDFDRCPWCDEKRPEVPGPPSSEPYVCLRHRHIVARKEWGG